MKPYYEHGGITIYHGSALSVLPLVSADVIVTDPPYGVDYNSGWDNALPGIDGDEDTSLRDFVLTFWGERPAVVFGSWKRNRPAHVKALLTWDKGPASGMGDLSMPWKPNTEEIYIIGGGFVGRRDSSVLSYRSPLTWNSVPMGRQHPHEKPVDLMCALIWKCPSGSILDPFMGSGSTLKAAKWCGRAAIGIEIEERYCEIAAKRLSQEVLPLELEPTTPQEQK